MTGPDRTSLYLQEERLARVVWAAHILCYLTKNRSHAELVKAENTAEIGSHTDDSSDHESDYETEKKMILSGPRHTIRRKFLDCIAQLLSPCKGWDGVTATAIREGEDGVEADIARNDNFLLDGGRSDGDFLEYCKMLEEYLEGSTGGNVTNSISSWWSFEYLMTGTAEIGMNITANSSTDFELSVIDYMSRRIDHWVKNFRKTLKIDQIRPDWSSERFFGQGAAVKA